MPSLPSGQELHISATPHIFTGRVNQGSSIRHDCENHTSSQMGGWGKSCHAKIHNCDNHCIKWCWVDTLVTRWPEEGRMNILKELSMAWMLDPWWIYLCSNIIYTLGCWPPERISGREMSITESVSFCHPPRHTFHGWKLTKNILLIWNINLINMPEIHSDRSRSRHRRPNKDNDCDESFDSTDELEDDPVVLERREKQAR